MANAGDRSHLDQLHADLRARDFPVPPPVFDPQRDRWVLRLRSGTGERTRTVWCEDVGDDIYYCWDNSRLTRIASEAERPAAAQVISVFLRPDPDRVR